MKYCSDLEWEQCLEEQNLDCGCCLQEATLLSEDTDRLRCQLEEFAKCGQSDDDDDAMYHLQMAQATLNERYAKLQKKNAELQKRLDQTTMKLVLANGYILRTVDITETSLNAYSTKADDDAELSLSILVAIFQVDLG